MSVVSGAVAGCAAINTIRASAISELLAIQAQFDMAKRTVLSLSAGIDAELGQLNRVIASLNGLSSVSIGVAINFPASISIDIAAYARIRQACPFLKLPGISLPSGIGVNLPVPGLSQLLSLAAAVTAALGSFVTGMERSVLGLINQLELKFQRQVAAALKLVLPYASILDCACSIADAAAFPGAEEASAIYKTLINSPTLLSGSVKASVDLLSQAKISIGKIVVV